MVWTKIANLRGPAGLDATGAAEDDAAIAAFIAGATATRTALDAAVAERGRQVAGDETMAGRVTSTVDYAPSETPTFIDQSTTGGLDHHAFPSGLTLRDGRHLVMYSSGLAHADSRVGKRAISSDDGATWTTSDNSAIIAGIDQFPDGALLGTGIEMIAGVINTRAKISTDAGATWTDLALFDFGYSGYTYPNDVVVLSNTEALAAVYAVNGTENMAVIAYTADRGVTWEKRAEIRQSPLTGGFQEPVMQMFPDGELLVFLRSGDGGTDLSIKIVRSFDYGVTFSAPETILTTATGRPDVHLTRSGLLVLGYRADPYGGGPQAWAVSTDRGHTWTVRTKFDPASSLQEVYMTWLEMANGDLGVAYALEATTQDVATLRFMRFARQSTLTPALSASEEIFSGAGEGYGLGATAGQVGGGWPAFLFADALTQQAAFVIRVPRAWKRFSISMLWTVATGAGDVLWRYDYDQVSAGSTLTSTSGSGLAVTAPAANVVKETVMAATVTRTGDLVRIRPTRSGAGGSDTLTADAAVLGVKIIRLA